MQCQQVTNYIDEYLDRCLGENEQRTLENHLRSCDACQRTFEEAQRFRAALRELPVPPVPTGFADRILRQAAQQHYRRRSLWQSVIGGTVAASLVLAVTLNLLKPVTKTQSADRTLTKQILALNETRKVNLVLDSDSELKGVTLTIQLPESVELQGFPGKRLISWKTDIQTGANLLSLPLVATGAANGRLVARLEHGNKSKELAVLLSVPEISGRPMPQLMPNAQLPAAAKNNRKNNGFRLLS